MPPHIPQVCNLWLFLEPVCNWQQVENLLVLLPQVTAPLKLAIWWELPFRQIIDS